MRIFLDTTYLMPLFALDPSIDMVREEFEDLLLNKDHSFHYQIVSIFEIKWLIIKAGKNKDSLRDKLEIAFSNALRFLENSSNITSHSFDEDIKNEISYEFEKYGHKDYFDTLILASAILTSDLMISEDESFPKIIEKQKQLNSRFYNPSLKIYSWREFKNINLE